MLHRPLRARDTQLMADAVQILGANLETHGNRWLISPSAAGRNGGSSVAIDCGLAGTVMRFVPVLAALTGSDVTFDGDPAARARPMTGTINTLRALGVDVTDEGRAALPFIVHGSGGITGGYTELDAGASSQFISALLLAAPAFADGLELVHTGTHLPSNTHINMTVAQLRNRGVSVDDSVPGRWKVCAGAIDGAEVNIEPDLSNAGPFIAAALVTGGSMTIHHWPEHTDQPGDQWRTIIEAFGGSSTRDGTAMTFAAGAELHGVDLDLHDAGELTPVVAAVAALAHSPSRLRGIAHLRGHETDRLRALAAEINNLGGWVTEVDDGLDIAPRALRGGIFHTYDDHRMAHAAAVLGLRVSDVQVENIDTTAKTYVGFAPAWEQLARP